VGQQDPVAGFEAGVGIYIDDVYLNRPQGALLDIYDVERIEVLRGPQGTLYGRNTIGGAVKYVTRRLDNDDPTANVRFTAGNYEQVDVVGTFSYPLLKDSSIGDLQVGGTLAYFRRDGFGHNLNLKSLDNYNKDILAGRVAIEWEPTETFSMRVSGDWTDDNSDPKQGHRLLDYPGFPVLDNVFDTRAGLNSPEQNVRSRGLSHVAEWQVMPSITLKNIVAYRDSDTTTPIDFDSLPIIDLDVPTEYRDHQFSEEFQVVYEGDRLSGILGFYYLAANARNDFDVLLANGVTNVFTSSDVDTRTWSVFGDFSYDLTDSLSLSVGGRYTQDERSIFLRREIFVNDGVTVPLGELSPSLGGMPRLPLLVQSNLDADADFDDFSPRASLTWEITPEHTVYASYAQGFKGGSFDPRCVATSAPDLDGDGTPGAIDFDDQRAFCLFDPEDIDTYEIGWKNSLFGGRFTSALALFYSDYKNIQIPSSIGVDLDNDGIADTFAGATTNAAASTLYGLEFEGNAILAEDTLTSGDSLAYQFSLGYIHAEFDEYIGRSPGPGLPPADLSDIAVFQNTPSITAYSRLSYSRPVSTGTGSIYTSVSYRSETHQFNFVSPIDQPAYALLNAGVSWTQESGRVKISLHGANLLDKKYVVAGYDFVTALPEFGNSPLGSTGVLTTFYGNPRQVFGTIEVAF
ncbi:MAG: TonB-dependent receptor, partial [Pseudomonadota bacterium]|nr:TonB-dependent receptor [Pseudomonadota bacterium]